MIQLGLRGVRRACAVVKQSRSAFYYQPRDHDVPNPMACLPPGCYRSCAGTDGVDGGMHLTYIETS